VGLWVPVSSFTAIILQCWKNICFVFWYKKYVKPHKAKSRQTTLYCPRMLWSTWNWRQLRYIYKVNHIIKF
jgi:hypothetical protein